ncbi:MAG: hypothetical protein HW388_307 [Dehalococcoidia bacterium]|nr:hypothetical protein [Dehalococcoidia bacterium]
MCYRDKAPILDLTGVHVACLCGDNGHGKSALLDAITWALWGKARARLQEELVYQGESEMRVELEFQAGEGCYRVARRFARASRGRQGHSDLQLFVSATDGWQPISGNSVRETETRICSLLRMDYDTFVNSAFILQGRADMFTTSTPAKRKELLGEVLNLSWYDRVAEKARGLVRSREATVGLLEREVGAMDKELSHKEGTEAHLKAIEEELGSMGAEARRREVELERLQGEAQRLQGLQQELLRLEQWGKGILEEIRERDSRLNQQRKHLEESRARAERLPLLQVELDASRRALEELAHPSQELERSRARLHQMEVQVHHLREINVTLRQEMEELRVKVDLLHEAGSGARCPLCDHELGEEGCQHLAAAYEVEGKGRASSHRGNEASIRQMEAEKSSLEKEMARREGEERLVRKRAEERRDLLVRGVEESKAATGAVSQMTQTLESEESLLEASRRRLKEVVDAIPPLKEAVSSLPGALKAYQEEKARLEELRSRQRRLLQEQGAVQGRLERCRDLEIQRREKSQALAAASHEKGVYDQLSVAFGKGGIQALLIEQALPELESQANELLGRITDYRMSLKLETQRERQSGGDPRETLDIKISDELGTRSYETYSGGEAFRINFALRVALSKLLAHRSGAPLPTLFIDEGFGTQDASGRDRLVEAIRSIQNDFQKIIVITHIEELKEAFPVRIEVTKTSQGSTFTMS